MLSLSPRYDLVRFSFPKDFLPTEIEEKYTAILNKENATLTTAIDYLNESIQSVTLPGISELTIQQMQHGSNGIKTNLPIKKLNVEPAHEMTYIAPGNPLEKIEKEFKVTFRANQGLINYFMLYETAFHLICKGTGSECEPILYIDLMDEKGTIISRVKYMDVHMDGLEGREFNYTKIDRESDTFEVTFKFNNIDFEYFINKDYVG